MRVDDPRIRDPGMRMYDPRNDTEATREHRGVELLPRLRPPQLCSNKIVK